MSPKHLLDFDIMFASVISSAIGILLQELNVACDGAFNAMLRMSWSTLDAVHEASPYALELARSLEMTVDAVRAQVEQKKYQRNFIDKAAKSVADVIVIIPSSFRLV